MIEKPFLSPAEVDEITGFTDRTRLNLEKRGRFPRRLRISPGRIAHRRTDIEAWIADPESWAKRPAVDSESQLEERA